MVRENSGMDIIAIRKTEQPLSKEQLAFNRLTNRIASLQRKIQSEGQRLDAIRTIYQENLFPAVSELGLEKIKLARLLEEKRAGVKLSHIQNSKLDGLIYQLLDDAFSVIEADEAAKTLYNKYAPISFDEEVTMQAKAVQEEFSDMFYERFGLKIDPADLGGNPDFAKIEENLKAQFEQKDASGRTGRKTKKQLQKEKTDATKEELKGKSLRRIYLSLAKILHPDTEPDEALRREKEDFMKKATVAYTDKNFIELLRLEMLWVNTQGQHLQGLDADTLKIYMQLLKDQVKELEIEMQMIYDYAAHSEIVEWLDMGKAHALKAIQEQARQYKQHVYQLSQSFMQLETTTRVYATLVSLIQDYYIPEDKIDGDEFDALIGMLQRR